MNIPADHGSYLIIGRLDHVIQLTTGSFSGQLLKKGYYLYSGSAFGPGGLRARISRHLIKDSKKFWHYDHLKASLCFEEILFSIDAVRQECKFIQKLGEMEGVSFPIHGFGSSDCRQKCPSHLARFPLSYDIGIVVRDLKADGMNLIGRPLG